MLEHRSPCRALIEWLELLPKAPTLHEQWVGCGTAGCRCTRGERHGPYFYLFWREDGRLRKRYVRAADVEAVQTACVTRRAREHQERRALDRGWREWRALVAQVREADRNER